MASGKFQTKRYFTSAAGWPMVASGQTSVVCVMPVRRSWRVTSPPPAPEPLALDQTIFESTGSGVAHPLSPPPTLRQAPRGMDGSSPNEPVFELLGPRAELPS